MRRIVMDAESDALLAASTKLHCLVLRDLDSDRVVSCTNSAGGYTSLEDGLALLSAAEVIYGHNIIHFDLPLLYKLYPGFSFNGLVRDTLITAQMRWAHIADSDFALFKKHKLPGAFIGSHALEAWGYRLGVQKVGTEIEDWSQWTELMQHRCESDTAITKLLVHKIQQAGVPAAAVKTEHALAFYLREQEKNGWPFDVEAAQSLQASLSAKRQAVEVELMKMFDPWQVSLGMFTPKVNNAKRGYVKGVLVERFKTVEFNPGSRDHIANRLQVLYGWEPSEFTDGGKPKVDETTMEGLDYPPVPLLKDYLLLTKRLGQIAEGKEAWLGHAVANPQTGLFHIHGRVKQNHAITHRASHASPNVSQVPAVYSPYGKECRSLWHVPEGWVEVGADASGLELRCLAHYMAKFDGGAYGKAVISEKPNDIHTLNATILGVDRDTAKTFIYALIYGAGDEKLGKILEPGASAARHQKIGKRARARFLKSLPALKYLLEAVQGKAKQKGYIKLIDGRKAYVRSEHAALNTLLQGTGAVICKRWIVEFDRRLTERFGPQGWDGQWAALGWIHDEVQLAVRETFAKDVGVTLVESIRSVTQHFNFRVPLDGEYKIGRNWAECH